MLYAGREWPSKRRHLSCARLSARPKVDFASERRKFGPADRRSERHHGVPRHSRRDIPATPRGTTSPQQSSHLTPHTTQHTPQHYPTSPLASYLAFHLCRQHAPFFFFSSFRTLPAMDAVDLRVELPAYSHSFPVQVPTTSTVLAIKEQINKACPGGPLPHGQRIIWRGRLLRDSERVQDIWKVRETKNVLV
jgi:hypothetical protein